MKIKFLISIILTLNIYLLKSQDIDYKHIPLYKKAVEYIKNDTSIFKDNVKNEIYISNEIVDLDRFWFAEKISSEPELKAVVDSLKKFSWFDNFYSKSLDSIFKKKNSSADKIIFFSKIEKNTLRVDLFMNRNKKFDYQSVIRFNKDKVFAYLFFFDKNGSIKKVLCNEIIYEPF